MNHTYLLGKRDFETDPQARIRPETAVFRSDNTTELGWRWVGLDPVWWRAGTVVGTVYSSGPRPGPALFDPLIQNWEHDKRQYG